MTGLLVWDASPLVHAGRADRLDVLGDLAASGRDGPWQHVVPSPVADEIRALGGDVPDWTRVEHVDGLDVLVLLARWVSRVGAGEHHRGEAAVLALAEARGATAVVDDKDARRVGRRYGLDVHGHLWLAAEAVRSGRWPASPVSRFLEQLRATGMRYPFGRDGFEGWAREEGLL